MQMKMVHIVFSQVCTLVLGVSVARSFFINDSGYNLSLGRLVQRWASMTAKDLRWQLPCTQNSFRSLGDTLCISKEKRCDRKKDCSHEEDERSCPNMKCRSDEFTCKNGMCIKKPSLCDGKDDCGDHYRKTTKPDLAMLAFGSQSGSYRIDLRNIRNVTSRVTHFKSKDIVSLDFGLEPHQIYWSDEKSINKLHINNGLSDEIAFRHDDVNDSLAVDSLANKVYWADAAQDAIYVWDLRNKRKVKVIREDLYSPIAIVLSQGYMFWTADCCPRPKIERARLDGTDRKILVIGGVQSKSDLAIDERDEKIYWAGINANKYCSIGVISLSLGDLSPAVIFDLSHSGYPSFSLNGSGDHVYNVQRTGKEVEVFMAGLNGPKGPTARPKRFGSRGPCKVGHGGSWRRRRRRICPPPIHHPMELTERDGENREQVQGKDERTLGVNTWLLIIILLLLALELGKRVLKKVSSFLKATHPGDVQGTRAEDQERACGIEEDFTTDNNTDVMHEGALLLNYDDESPELNQQVCTAETKGACVHRGDLPFQVHGDLVVYMNMSAVNVNTMSMNMNTTNNVELQQNGGVTVVGDKANINYHQPSQ